jgi:hypothetical protein
MRFSMLKNFFFLFFLWKKKFPRFGLNFLSVACFGNALENFIFFKFLIQTVICIKKKTKKKSWISLEHLEKHFATLCCCQ